MTKIRELLDKAEAKIVEMQWDGVKLFEENQRLRKRIKELEDLLKKADYQRR